MSDINEDFPVVNRSALLVKPTGEFVAWLKAVPGDPLERTLKDVQDDSSIYLLPDVLQDPDGWLRRNYRPIFEQELVNWCTDDSLWPEDLSFKTFKLFFEVSFHSMVCDLGKGSIEAEKFVSDDED